MPDKSKRKINPRRRTLFRLIIFTGIVIALIASGVYLLRPEGAQIVFIAPDEDGIDQIWLANINNPENPHQLTAHDSRVGYLYVDNPDSKLLYSVQTLEDQYSYDFWLMNLLTRQTHKLPFSCDIEYGCGNFSLSPDGRWIVYQEGTSSDEITFEYTVYLYDIRSNTTRIIYEQTYNQYPSLFISPNPQWVGNTNSIIYRIYNHNYDESQFVLYDIQRDEVIDRITTEPAFLTPIFSNDGSAYTYQSTNTDDCCVFPLMYQANDFEVQLPGMFEDWHPDNQQILITESHTVPDVDKNAIQYELILLNPITATQDALTVMNFDPFYQSINFNNDGSQILYNVTTDELGIHQIGIFDMETREEIPLPLFGYYPQWVNGGR